MEERDIYRLFSRVAEHAAPHTGDVQKVFSLLVTSTLWYRDHMLESTGVTVTVEDVRAALGWLVPSLVSGQIPETDNKIRLGLLETWLSALDDAGTT